MILCQKCGGTATMHLSWAMSEGAQDGMFCRQCAKELNGLLSVYGFTVEPIPEAEKEVRA